MAPQNCILRDRAAIASRYLQDSTLRSYYIVAVMMSRGEKLDINTFSVVWTTAGMN